MRTKDTTKRERAQVYRGDGKMVGGITGDVFHKTVRASKHFLRQPPAIAFDLDMIAEAKANGARLAEVIDSETGKVYRATLEKIWKRGFTFDRNRGRQIGLILSEWNCDNATPTREAKPTQPALFNLSHLAR